MRVTGREWFWIISGTLFAAMILVIITSHAYPMEATAGCQDGISAGYATDGTLYGDANGDGTLSGEECDYR